MKLEIIVEKYCVIAASVGAAVLWRFWARDWHHFIVADKSIIYQTLLMFSTIVLALMATVEAILLTAEGSEGIKLLKTNAEMFNRFLNYIFWCILSNLLFCVQCFIFLLLQYEINSSRGSIVLIFLGAFSFLSLLRILVLFKFIVMRRE